MPENLFQGWLKCDVTAFHFEAFPAQKIPGENDQVEMLPGSCFGIGTFSASGTYVKTNESLKTHFTTSVKQKKVLNYSFK